MPRNIKEITIAEKSFKGNDIRPVVINFAMPCEFTLLGLQDLKDILYYWIIGEEEKYPQSKGFKGRWLLFEEIKKVFDETPTPEELRG